jgi:replicative DNA helicase
MESPIVREKYIRMLAEETGFSENAIYEEIGVKKYIKGNDWNNSSENKVSSGHLKSEEYVLLRLCENPACMDKIAGNIAEDDFEDSTYKKIFSVINQKIKKGFMPTDAEILSELSEEGELGRATALFSSEPEFTGTGKLADDYLADCLRDMRARRLKKTKDTLLNAYNNEKNEDIKSDLLNKINRLSKEIHEIKERLD